MKDALLSYLLIQASINTENQLMEFSDSSWKYFTDTGRSTGAYMIFYQGGPIDHVTHVTGPVAQSFTEIECNAARTAGMVLSQSRMLIHEFLNKDQDIVPDKSLIFILDSKSAICMDNNGKYTNNTRRIAKKVHCVTNGEK